MPRVKRGAAHVKRRRRILRQAKGYVGRRSTHLRLAREALTKAGQYAMRDRRKKKGVFRRLWNVQLSAALREHDVSYSVFINNLSKSGITLDRKVLAKIAQQNPDVFGKIVAESHTSNKAPEQSPKS